MSVVGEIYVGILVDRFRRVTESLIDDEKRVFRSVWGCVDQILSLKQIYEKAREKS